ncbi:MAG: hypothetical protein PHO01_12145 [Desulfotomaculaceae bacterium]|nr:hypothetical protein [Desulfotomaculaceae bacterium]
MAGNGVVFEKLILQGFGPYRKTTTFTFAQGVNGYIAANEKGKTSMMAGLLATIFGLTHRRRGVSAFNLGRFRNWDNPVACRGELVLSSLGKRYRIQRNFDTHQVALWELAEDYGLRQLVVEGQHNPEARKPLRRYEEEVHRILGVSSQDLFEETFFVAQPLPEVSQISANLQGLLAGGRGASFQAALVWLLAKLKILTKYTGPNNRKVTARNMSKDGLLEQLTEEIRTLKEQISAGQQSADSLADIRIKIGTVEEELKKERRELKQRKSAHQAWSGWQLLASHYAAAATKRILASAINQIAELTDAWWQEREAEAIQPVKLRKEQEALQLQQATIGKLIEDEKRKTIQLQQELQSWKEKLSLVLEANENPEQAHFVLINYSKSADKEIPGKKRMRLKYPSKSKF